MKLGIFAIGKSEAWIKPQLADYAARIGRYVPSAYEELIPHGSKGRQTESGIRQAEGAQLMARLQPSDRLFLFDERGEQFSSAGLALFLDSQISASPGRICLALGGAYGWSPEVLSRKSGLIGLSNLTLTHQHARLIALEAVYRAFTILRGEKYHH